MNERASHYSGPSAEMKQVCIGNKGILNRRSQPARHPLHRVGLGYDLIDVIAIDALKRTLLESDPRRFDVGFNGEYPQWRSNFMLPFDRDDVPE